MEYVNIAIQKTFVYYAVIAVGIIICIALGIFYVCKNNQNSEKIGILTIVLIIALIVHIFTSVGPFAIDVMQENISSVEGVYTNLLADKSKSPSSRSGVFSVTLETLDGVIDLTTAPNCKDVFLEGTYHVIAYYTANSKILLHIEIIE